MKLSKSGWQTLYSIVLSATLLFSATASADYANDRALIENLSNRYMIAVDAGDIDTVMETWAEDGRLESVFGIADGKQAIYDTMAPFNSPRAADIASDEQSRRRTRHQIINHVIDVDGDTAHTICYWFAFTNRTPQGDVQILYFGHYEDELERIDGEWKFKVRRVYNESQPNKKLWYPELGEVDPRELELR